MAPKGVRPEVKTADALISRNPAYIHWITANPATIGTAGTLIIYDGFDTGGKKIFELISGYDRFCLFDPPIDCRQGIYVDIDAAVTSYSIAYESKARGQ